jgi:DHA2 family multidrug resistance protein
MADSDSSREPISRGGIARHPLFAVGAVLLGAFLANLDSRLTSIGLPDLRGGFSLGFDEGAWLSTAAIGSQIFVAPSVAWLATVFGLRRVLGIPSLIYAVVSLVIPFVHQYPVLIALSIVHGMLLGTFVPATLMIIFRNLPICWWLPGSRSTRSGSVLRSIAPARWSVSMSIASAGSGCTGMASCSRP